MLHLASVIPMRIGVRQTKLHEGGTPLPVQQPQLCTNAANLANIAAWGYLFEHCVGYYLTDRSLKVALCHARGQLDQLQNWVYYLT